MASTRIGTLVAKVALHPKYLRVIDPDATAQIYLSLCLWSILRIVGHLGEGENLPWWHMSGCRQQVHLPDVRPMEKNANAAD